MKLKLIFSPQQLKVMLLFVVLLIITRTVPLKSKSIIDVEAITDLSARRLRNRKPKRDSITKTKEEDIEQSRSKQTISIPPHYGTFKVLETIPHDPNAFTQGLCFHDGILYESTGRYDKSKVKKINPETGYDIEDVDLASKYFGEGLAVFDDGKKLIQLTWLENSGFIYDANTLEDLKTFKYDNKISEGWGITHDPENNTFIISDGSSWLHIWDAETLEEIRKVEVTLPNKSKRPVDSLNELEWDGNGTVLANRWYRDVILRIEIATGEITTIYNFERLWPRKQRRNTRADSFNGIATTDVKGEYYVTGKLWPKMYRVKLN